MAERVEAFGQARINAERIILRRTLSDAINQCHQPNHAVSDAIHHFCNYYKKDELQMLVEVANTQEKRVLAFSKRSTIPATSRYVCILK